MRRWTLPALIVATACSASTSPPSNEWNDADLLAGRQAYLANGCRVCHGLDGRGDGPVAHALQPKPRDFSDASAFKNGRTVDAVAAAIAAGVPSRPTPMPPFGHLDEQTRRNIAAWVLSRVDVGRAESSKESP